MITSISAKTILNNCDTIPALVLKVNKRTVTDGIYNIGTTMYVVISSLKYHNKSIEWKNKYE